MKHKQVIEMKIVDLVERVRADRYALPAFQRDFVWSPSQMAKLIESIVRHYPIGTLMLIDASENDDLGKSSFLGTDPRAIRPTHFVIDGQQRIKSLYDLLAAHKSFTPTAPIRYKGGNYKVFYRVGTSLNEIDRADNVEKPTFIFPKKVESHEADEFERQGHSDQIPIEFVLSGEYSKRWVDAAYPRRRRPAKKAILKNISEIRKRILSYECPVEMIRMKLKANHHANMFRLLNEGGTDLTLFDLLVAKLNLSGVDLRSLWNKTRREHSVLDEFRVDPIYILQTMHLLRKRALDESPSCSKKEIKRIDQLYSDEKNPKKLIEHDWRNAALFLEKAIVDLKNQFGVAAPKYLPYSPMMVPLAGAKWHIQQYAQRFQAEFKRRLKRWYWGAIFNKKFDKSTDTRMAKHFIALTKWLTPGRTKKVPVEISFAMNKGQIEDAVRRVRSSADAIYNAVLCLPLVEGAEDIYSNEYLRDGVLLHDHHIFPRGFLKDGARGEAVTEEFVEQMNHIVNRMLITDRTNQEIKKKSPHDYLKKVNHKILRRHFLFQAIHKEKLSFEEFLERRRRMIVNYVYHQLVN